ncbi:MAG: hypothetical protein V1728_02705 [Candidatus Micrarchaeota archaeon]
MAQKDSVFGMASTSFPVYENGLDPSGTFYICEGGLVIKTKDKLIRSPFKYVRKLERFGDLPLGKINVIMKFFDQMGNEYDMVAGMSDMHYAALLKVCPDAKTK